MSINNNYPMMLNMKGNANLGSTTGMPVVVETNPDGSLNYALPYNAPPDSVGYNKNRVFQMERKSKIRARLQAKLSKKI
jgi:hypothetical protein